MKNISLKEKFKNNIFVKPLYRKVQRKVRPNTNTLLVAINVDNTYKLGGTDIDIKRQYIVNTRALNVLPGSCENEEQQPLKNIEPALVNPSRDHRLQEIKMLRSTERELNDIPKQSVNKLIQAERLVVIKNIPDHWLRVYPLPALHTERACSVIFRCVFCQLGLATVIVLWTVLWTFLIHSFEAPYEEKVSSDFKSEQNQLVIDLATELRQITPISPKWREAIENRINEERQLTVLAVSRGVRSHPGQFWDLPGTFLFAVYIMTALGFGAPVPHTVYGRTSAMIYALLAVPTHIYLMLNTSTCLITKLEACCCGKKNKKRVTNYETSPDDQTDSPNCSRHSEVKNNSTDGKIRKKLLRVVCLPCAGHCVPLAIVAYYAIGAVSFGVLRNAAVFDALMFPLEFTTTGGLELVEGYVRILYGVYIEGAMLLISCALAILRRHSSGRINSMAENYRLFQTESH